MALGCFSSACLVHASNLLVASSKNTQKNARLPHPQEPRWLLVASWAPPSLNPRHPAALPPAEAWAPQEARLAKAVLVADPPTRRAQRGTGGVRTTVIEENGHALGRRRWPGGGSTTQKCRRSGKHGATNYVLLKIFGKRPKARGRWICCRGAARIW